MNMEVKKIWTSNIGFIYKKTLTMKFYIEIN